MRVRAGLAVRAPDRRLTRMKAWEQAVIAEAPTTAWCGLDPAPSSGGRVSVGRPPCRVPAREAQEPVEGGSTVRNWDHGAEP